MQEVVTTSTKLCPKKNINKDEYKKIEQTKMEELKKGKAAGHDGIKRRYTESWKNIEVDEEK